MKMKSAKVSAVCVFSNLQNLLLIKQTLFGFSETIKLKIEYEKPMWNWKYPSIFYFRACLDHLSSEQYLGDDPEF